MLDNWQNITGQWCFNRKKDQNGQVLKYKARWAAHGFKQEQHINSVKTFAVFVKPISYKCLFTVCVECRWKISKRDVVTAFLNRFLDEIIYVEQPHLLEHNFELVCCLCKALYGLKQVLHVWYQTVAEFFQKIELERLELDHGVLVLQDCQLFLAIYI